MSHINLIPMYRLHARGVRKRISAWLVVVAGCAGSLVAAHLWMNAMWHDDSAALQAAIDKADAESGELERQSAVSRAAVAEAQATLRARRAVSDQPDWGLLLATLAARLDQQAVLSACSLEPSGPQAGSDGRGENQRTSAAGGRFIRPSQYTLSLAGLTRTQDAASSIAIALEGTGLFERVTLLEARRSGFLGEDAVNFRLECALADPAAEVQ